MHKKSFGSIARFYPKYKQIPYKRYKPKVIRMPFGKMTRNSLPKRWNPTEVIARMVKSMKTFIGIKKLIKKTQGGAE